MSFDQILLRLTLTPHIVFCSVQEHAPWRLAALLQVSLPFLQPLWPVCGKENWFVKHRSPPCECQKQGRRFWRSTSAAVPLPLTALAPALALSPQRQFSVNIFVRGPPSLQYATYLFENVFLDFDEGRFFVGALGCFHQLVRGLSDCIARHF